MHNVNIINPVISDFIYSVVEDDNYIIEKEELIALENGERIVRVTSEWMEPDVEITLNKQNFKMLKDYWKYKLLKGNTSANNRSWETSRFLPESLKLNQKNNSTNEYSVTFDVTSEALNYRNIELSTKFKLIDQAIYLIHADLIVNSQFIVATDDTYLLCGSISGRAEDSFLDDFCELFNPEIHDVSLNIEFHEEGIFFFSMTYLQLEINKDEKGLDGWAAPFEMPVEFVGQIDDIISLICRYQGVSEDDVRIIRI